MSCKIYGTIFWNDRFHEECRLWHMSGDLIMTIKKLSIASFAGAILLSTAAFAQTATSVDPACLIKNADGTETVDKAKCPDGIKVGASEAAPAAPDSTATTAPMTKSLIVPPESFSGATVISANDFIGKRVYTRAGDDIGEVNDLIMTGNGGIQAVVLGVGGFLGIGEKDVAVSMASIDMAKDGSTVRLTVDGTKEQFNAAPSYDRTTRTYLK
jgi:sporulation protein YlmC with PRC-barrel domain